MIALEDCRCGLDVAQARTNAVAFSPSPFCRIVSEEEGTVARVIQLRVGTDFLIHRQQPLAVCQQDRSVANHGAGLEGHLEGFRPGLGFIARDLGGDARVAPKLAVAGDVKEPNHMVGSLPDHRITQRVEGIAGDGYRFRPSTHACFQARTEDSRLVVFVFTPTAEKDHEEVAVVQFGEARRVLVVAGLDLGPEESFPFEGRHRQCSQQSQNKDGCELRISLQRFPQTSHAEEETNNGKRRNHEIGRTRSFPEMGGGSKQRPPLTSCLINSSPALLPS